MKGWILALVITWVGAYLQRAITMPFAPGPLLPGALGAMLVFWFVIGLVMGIAYFLNKRPRLWMVATWVTIIVGVASTLGMMVRFANTPL